MMSIASGAARGGRLVALLAIVLCAACQAPPPATKTGASAPPPAAPSASGGGAAPAAAQAAPDSAWDRLLAEGRKEGVVRLSLPPGVPGLGDVFGKAFEEDTGIKVDSAADQATAATRIEQEAATGKVTIDVLFGGAQELLHLYPKGLLEPIAPKLVNPDVTDLSKWRDNQLKWADKAQQHIFVTGQWVHADLMVNASVVDPAGITSWNDLLKPEYKGKIVAQEVHVGAGGAAARAILEAKGPDYVKALYQGQEVTVTRDAREVVQLLSRGSHPIAIAVLPQLAEGFKKQGIRLERVFPADGIPGTSGGQGAVKIIKNAPHPNAAAVFVNWYASKRGQELYSGLSLEQSRRLDVDVPAVPDYVRLKPGVQYRDHYDEEFYLNVAPAMLKQLEEILGR